MNDVELIKLDIDHLEMVRNWRNSLYVSASMYSDNEITEEQQQKWFLKINDDTTCKYWVVNFKGIPVGLAYLTDLNQSFDSCYMGFYLKDSSVSGTSIAAKLEFNLLEYVFTVLKLNKLRCEVFEFNKQVISMHEKFGFRREAFYREHCKKNGKYENVVGLAMLSNEWKVIASTLGTKIYGKFFLENKNGK